MSETVIVPAGAVPECSSTFTLVDKAGTPTTGPVVRSTTVPSALTTSSTRTLSRRLDGLVANTCVIQVTSPVTGVRVQLIVVVNELVGVVDAGVHRGRRGHVGLAHRPQEPVAARGLDGLGQALRLHLPVSSGTVLEPTPLVVRFSLSSDVFTDQSEEPEPIASRWYQS